MDFSVRFCKNYSKLNTIIKHDAYPVTLKTECIKSSRDTAVFLFLFANSIYSQIEVREFIRDKTAQTSCHGLYWFKQIRFGLNDVSETFQLTVDVML